MIMAMIVSGNGLSPVWRQAINGISDNYLSIELLGTNFSEILSKMQSFSFSNM